MNTIREVWPLGVKHRANMDTFILIVRGLVVLGCIYMGVREGGLGLGIWGLAGVFLLVFVFRQAPGDPPIDAVFIVIAVITAASAMQAAGGTARRHHRRRRQHRQHARRLEA